LGGLVIWWVDNDKDVLNPIVKNTGIVPLILVEQKDVHGKIALGAQW
jgi:hypothetical protein